MHAHKWLSNSKAVLKVIPPQDRASQLELDKNSSVAAKSTAVRVKAFKDDCSLHKGRGAIICFAHCAFFLIHTAHSFSHSNISSLAAIIQYLVDKEDSV